jgi:hypothetical protein
LLGRRVYTTLWTRIGDVWLKTVNGYRTTAPLVINEIMTFNRSTIADEDGDYAAWFELANTGPDEVSLESFRIFLDGVGNWTFPDARLRPHGYLIVWVSGKDRRDADGPLHTNFTFDTAGAIRLDLLSAAGVWSQVIPVDAAPADRSWARRPDRTGEFTLTADPSPGKAPVPRIPPRPGKSWFNNK